MARNSSLRRRGPVRDPLPRLLVVCEGEVTEKRYIEYLRHTERIPINLTIVAGGTPKTLVETALAELASASRSSDPNDHFDQAWCVFDIDEHPKIHDAVQQAQAHKIGLIISNPCFDLWILLHFQDQQAHIHRHAVQKACRKHIPGYAKVPPCGLLFQRFAAAEARARHLKKLHLQRGTTTRDNPSTNVHELVHQLRAYNSTARNPH